MPFLPVILGLFARHALTVAGGAVGGAAVATQSPEEAIIAAVLTAVGLIWSYVQKKRSGGLDA